VISADMSAAVDVNPVRSIGVAARVAAHAQALGFGYSGRGSWPDRAWPYGGPRSTRLGDLDGDVGGVNGGNHEHSWLQAELVGGFAAKQ
jgi:hypothetical protein